MQVLVKIKACMSQQTKVDFTDEKVPFDVNPETSFKQLKEIIYKKEGYVPEEQTLLFATVSLHDDIPVGKIAQMVQVDKELEITCMIKESQDKESGTVMSDLDEKRWIVTGSRNSFRHYVIPARSEGDRLTFEPKGLVGFLKQEVKFMVVKQEGTMNDGHGDIRWEGPSYTLDREKHKQYLLLNKDFKIILKNDNSVEVEYMDNQHGLVKQKLQPDSDSKVFHEQALEYSKAVNNQMKSLLSAGAAAAKLGAFAL